MPLEKFEKIHALRLNLVLFEAQNCYAKDILVGSIISEILLAVPARVAYPEGVKSILDPYP